jgi:hypothetical protein
VKTRTWAQDVDVGVDKSVSSLEVHMCRCAHGQVSGR